MENRKTFDKWINRHNANKEITEIVKALRPHWSDTTIKQLEAGEINQLIVCHNSNGCVQDNDSIIFRFRHDMRDLVLFGFKAAVAVMRKASEAGLCGKVLATYLNGTVLQYTPGRTLKWDDVENPHILRLCAETLADFHSLDWKVGDLDNARTQMEMDAVSQQPVLFSRMREAMNDIPDHIDDPAVLELLHSELWQKEELSAELDYVSELVQKLNLPILFSHNDVHINNLIYDEKKDKMYLIDYDMAAFNFEAFDLANMFYQETWKTVGLIPEETPPASPNQIECFLQIYFKRRFGLVENDPQYAKLLKKYFYQVKAFITLNCLFWSSTLQLLCLRADRQWAKGDKDYRGLPVDAKKAYLEGREEMIQLLSDLAEFKE